MRKTVYEDHKYVVQDTHCLYIGAKYTLEELLENEDLPIKFRLIAERYLYREEDKDTSLESYFYYLTDKTLFYKVFRQLKGKLQVSILEEKSGFLRKTQKQYAAKQLPLEELMKWSPAEKETRGVVIQEVVISKLAMMAF
ncbi:MAG: hypothetical protein LBQ15_05915 [Clostridium sp.]|jgi:hypothetical protein|nr:hypothetical protein [Clostridium sp.]